MAESGNGTPERATVTKRRRDPERTREEILEVAGRLLAKDGAEGLSVSQVAQLAGVNRGTAYHHFQTREQLLKATTSWVSDKLCHEVFGLLSDDDQPVKPLNAQAVLENLVNFAMEYPDFGRVWLAFMLNSSRPEEDRFWCLFKKHMDRFVASDIAMPGVDGEVQAVLISVSAVLWPVWKRAAKLGAKERKELARRFTEEVLRYSLHGVMQEDKFLELTSVSSR